jgi:uncharacterized peroxidase-related enzyme
VDQLKKDYREADLNPRERTILDFAVEVTHEPNDITPRRMDELRAAGLSDEDILNIVHVVGFFSYYNRMVDALGVEPEDFMPKENASELQ